MKFCPYCGRQANDNDLFCQGCGARFEENGATPRQETVIPETVVEDKPKGAPHWLIKMLSIIALVSGLIFQGPIAVGTGIASLVLDKKGEFRGKAIAGIVLGSIWITIYVLYYAFLYVN